MLEAVVNVAEGRRPDALDDLRDASGAALLDAHTDIDHDRSVFTLVGRTSVETEAAVRRIADAVASGSFDLADSHGVHPRLGVLDVVPFIALDEHGSVAVTAARAFADWFASTHGVPVFLYDDADPAGRSLPEARREAFTSRAPDAGPERPHPRLGATAVGARPPMIAVNCELETADLDLARRLARAVRARDGGLEGVRALAFPLPTRRHVQVSMNLVDLTATGLEAACARVRDLARDAGVDVARVELVGLITTSELGRTSNEFSVWSGVTAANTIEAAMARVVDGSDEGDASAAARPPRP